MKQKLLFPNKYKRLGWLILIPSTILGIVLILNSFDGVPLITKVFAIIGSENLDENKYFTLINADIKNTIVGVLFIVGALLVAFSKEKNEDEFISNLRFTSLLWAVLINYLLLLFCFIFIYGLSFINVMLYNMFTVLIIFIGRFNYVLYRNSKSMSNEEFN